MTTTVANNCEVWRLHMKKALIAGGLLVLSAAIVPGAMAKGDKVLSCHVTGISLEGDRYEGHVISISTNALEAHCSHSGIPDHRPNGVISNALEECETDDVSSRCVVKYATGRSCSRGIDAEGPVNRLCGS